MFESAYSHLLFMCVLVLMLRIFMRVCFCKKSKFGTGRCIAVAPREKVDYRLVLCKRLPRYTRERIARPRGGQPTSGCMHRGLNVWVKSCAKNKSLKKLYADLQKLYIRLSSAAKGAAVGGRRRFAGHRRAAIPGARAGGSRRGQQLSGRAWDSVVSARRCWL